MPPSVAYFISPHGFGHAARSCAVMEAVWRRSPATRFELFTTTPRWFFTSSLSRPTGYHEVTTDIGLVQRSALEEDLGATVRRLHRWIPFRPGLLDGLSTAIATLGCGLVLCDIAPLGLAVAGHSALPSVLIENFTWDWIYRAYAGAEPALAGVADELERVFSTAGQRIQAEPLCQPLAAAIQVPPISRAPRLDRAIVRQRLGVPEDAELVMVTMGGVEWDYAGIDARLTGNELTKGRERWLVIPGSTRKPCRIGRTVLLPHRCDFYHPDLIHAADAVVGKLGYSTVAEVYRAGIPFGYIPRPTFPESPPLEAWVRRHLPHRRIDAAAFISWDWLDESNTLLSLPRNPPDPPDGGDAVARRVLDLLAGHP